MDIKNTRRILAVGAKDGGVIETVKALTGSTPTPNATDSTAGLTLHWDLSTSYYTARVAIWLDELGHVPDWRQDFLQPEAEQVVRALGAWIYCFQTPQDETARSLVEDTLEAIRDIVDQHCAGGGDGSDSEDGDVLLLAVAMPPGSRVASTTSTATVSGGRDRAVNREALEDSCLERGFELIDFGATGKNEFGEKQGVARLREALEAVSWEDAGSPGLGYDEDDEATAELLAGLDLSREGLEREEVEMGLEFLSLKAALGADDDADDNNNDGNDGDKTQGPAQQAQQVDDLDRIMHNLAIVKERTAGLPEADRKRLAAKAVIDLMKMNPNIADS